MHACLVVAELVDKKTRSVFFFDNPIFFFDKTAAENSQVNRPKLYRRCAAF